MALQNLAASGSYSIGADGRGTLTLNSSINPITLRFVMVSSARALVARFDTFATASGSIDRQDTTAFTNGALLGSFAFGVAQDQPAPADEGPDKAAPDAAQTGGHEASTE